MRDTGRATCEKVAEMERDDRNGEGYPDPTARAAIRDSEKEERRKNMSTEYYTGDIVEAEEKTGIIGTYAIVATHETYMTALRLAEMRTERVTYEVIAKEKMYTDPGRLVPVYNNKIRGLVRSMSDKETDNLRREVKDALCLNEDDFEEPEAENLNSRAEDAEKRAREAEEKAERIQEKLYEMEYIQRENAGKKNEEDSKKEILIAVQAERNLYKKLYEETLERAFNMA